MKKPSSKIRAEITRLQEELKQAETREAERIGRLALKAGLGEIDFDEAELQAAFDGLARRFRAGKPVLPWPGRDTAATSQSQTAALTPGATTGALSEA